MADKTFTLEEAMALLPIVRQLIVEIQTAKRAVDEASELLERLLVMTGGNGHLTADIGATRTKLENGGARVQELMGELGEIGAELKGIEQGLVDFPSELEGRVVYLCWQLGEETIAYWHELDTGFGGRQPL